MALARSELVLSRPLSCCYCFMRSTTLFPFFVLPSSDVLRSFPWVRMPMIDDGLARATPRLCAYVASLGFNGRNRITTAAWSLCHTWMTAIRRLWWCYSRE